MAFKFIVVLALASVASAGHLTVAPAYAHGGYAHGAYAVAAPAPAYVKTIAAAPAVLKTVEYEAPAQYDFSYGVSDPLTGDHKSQAESRHGDNVHGSYSLVDSDGFKRTVEYTADEHNGFNAVVRREPLAHAVAAPVAKVVAPVAAVAPVAQYASAHYTAQYASATKVVSAAAPIHYATAPVAYAAPIAKFAAPVLASAHYAPSVVANAAHYAPATYTSYGAHAVHAYHH
ncbi:unnamed protein product [Hermetia illucens]|uniref:Cuticle protein n=1 Tax=Hermetia illucens TaxID=343691 RepID=A0A7R8UTX3_HERIL|nr:larval cuticle protein A3A-like [Hermetia illucens]CAD7086503.1 unnamed protein product [Hermetia illucens]